ncbi:MAG: hypothetical protein RLZZ175_1061 [Bacteroidota bacterium]
MLTKSVFLIIDFKLSIMKNVFYKIAILLLIISACEKKNNSESNAKKRIVLSKLKQQKKIADKQQNNIEVYVKLHNSEKPVKVLNDQFPENIEITYNIIRDNSKKIVAISAFPYSESGDWDISLTHYFDNHGKTYAFENLTSFFNGNCVDEESITYQTSIKFFNEKFELIENFEDIRDEKNKILSNDSCHFSQAKSIKLFENLQRYLNEIKIEKTNI